jgi:hypothetical protein
MMFGFAWAFFQYGEREVAEPEPEWDTEYEDVRVWRSEQAVKLGLTPVDAYMFAYSLADLNELRRLVQAGCPPETAARILV